MLRYFDHEPTFWVAFTPALIVASLLFVRSPFSNYIFDEQEALLANPYVNGDGIGFWEVFRRDFWGLPPERSIGSYRPIPNIVWRLLWSVSKLPFLHHWVNVVGHAINAALVASFTFAFTRERRVGWLAGGVFLTSAVLTEAVSGVVGIADVLGGLGVLSALAALRLPLGLMPIGVALGLTFGLFSKESAIVGVPLLAWAALVTAPALHERPRRILRALFASLAAVAALVFYTEFRRRFFPVGGIPRPAPVDPSLAEQALHAFLKWFRQPELPSDPINNPLVEADTAHRVAGALRVYARGLGQVLFPWTLSGDYSYPAEPVPERLVFPGSVMGALALIGLPLVGLAAFVASLRTPRAGVEAPERRLAFLRAVALGAVWLPVAYFPHSNILVLLPTVRAERFWYLPLFGAAVVLAAVFAEVLRRSRKPVVHRLVVAFFAVQTIAARGHALDYSDDLTFWRATRRAVPDSAKAHLNYSVMVGARGRLEERLEANRRALDLAPHWAMANVYYGDTLCRLRRTDEAWAHYLRGFELAPNDPNLIALALQCLWDQKAIASRKDELLEIAQRQPGTWLAFLATDIVHNGEQHQGVQKKYRPRSYDEGPRQGS
nr:MAG: tetratricopeptide repeat-containing protein [Pseudomonadota bacterium]